MEPNNVNNIRINIALKKYFDELNTIKSDVLAFKPQHIDKIPEKIKGNVNEFFKKAGLMLSPNDKIIELLGINQILNKDIETLSGGELQRFATFCTMSKNAKIYMFDESSSYLDIRQRINLAKAIRSIESNDKYIYVVDHDLAILDYMCDYIYLMYGKPSTYGVVSQMMNISDGINIFLDGYIPSENMRFRDLSLSFKINREDILIEKTENKSYDYPLLSKTHNNFKLTVEKSSFNNNEINVLLGENGTGKTTFVKLLAGKLQPDDNVIVPEMIVSYKQQIISPKFDGTVSELLYQKIKTAMTNTLFNLEIVKPLGISQLMDKKVKELSGGELQCVAITLCLGQPADVYLLDEPSSFLDCSKRVTAAKVIRRFILNNQKSCFVVEHDLLMILYLADKVMLFEGQPGVNCSVSGPISVVKGLNKFLQNIDVSMRKDIKSGRPRFNKLNSVMDSEQKSSGQYIFLD